MSKKKNSLDGYFHILGTLIILGIGSWIYFGGENDKTGSYSKEEIQQMRHLLDSIVRNSKNKEGSSQITYSLDSISKVYKASNKINNLTILSDHFMDRIKQDSMLGIQLIENLNYQNIINRNGNPYLIGNTFSKNFLNYELILSKNQYEHLLNTKFKGESFLTITEIQSIKSFVESGKSKILAEGKLIEILPFH